MIEVNNIKYDIVKNYRDAFDKDEFIEKCTDYFSDYDYIVGDIAYGKLRLKGFYDSKNKKVKDLNNIFERNFILRSFRTYIHSLEFFYRLWGLIICMKQY